jgi:hypothetical protein
MDKKAIQEGYEMVEAVRARDISESKSVIDYVIPTKEMLAMVDRVEEKDEQAGKLLMDVLRELRKKMEIDQGTADALNRIQGLMLKGKNWSPELVRNNVFKAANDMKIKLPSGMF